MDYTVFTLSSKWNLKRVGLHVAFWVFYLSFFGLICGKYGENYKQHLRETAVMLPFIMLAVYCTIYGILPHYFKKLKLWLSIGFVILLQIIVTLGERIAILIFNQLPLTSGILFDVNSLYLMLETNFMLAIAFGIKVYKIGHELQEEKLRNEKQNLENELQLLKAQLHPHFLFNTMNNLYALSLEDKAKTTEGIAKISELLRSVLYECNEREIPLEREIAIIENYIELEKMRYGDRLNLKLRVEGETANTKIAPMILFTFVENCFKHGNAREPGDSFVDIRITINNGEFIFKAINSTPKIQTEAGIKKKGGIGLNNVRKRLEILYPGKYELTCKGEDDCYHVSLILRR